MFARRLAFLLVSLVPIACLPKATPQTDIIQPLRSGRTSCAGTPAVDTTVYDTTQVTETPRTRTVLELLYPAEAARNGIEGTVVVAAIVNADGTIDQRSVDVVRSAHPLLDQEVVHFIGRATMWPACRNSEPVRVKIMVPVDFDLREAPPGTRDPRLLGAVIAVGAIVLVLSR